MINEIITCISDAYPAANYLWKCSGEKWHANDSSLVCLEPGHYTCTCTAQNVIHDFVRVSVWKGNVSISDPNIPDTTTIAYEGT